MLSEHSSVKVKPSTSFYHQAVEHGNLGLVIGSGLVNKDWSKVEFEDGYINYYPDDDLEYTHKLEVGARVKLSERSPYYGQCSAVGNIVRKDIGSWYRVEFDNGYSNSYRDYDLVVVTETQEACKVNPVLVHGAYWR
jgi:hypothetical protein